MATGLRGSVTVRRPLGDAGAGDESAGQSLSLSLSQSQSREESEALLRQLLADDRAPSVSAAVVGALRQDAACKLLLSFVTRLAPGAREELQPEDASVTSHRNGSGSDTSDTSYGRREDEGEAAQASEALRLSFRATMLLTNDDTSDALLSFLADKSKLVTRRVFAVFSRHSAGNLRHGCRIIDFLMRLYLDDVYDVVGDSPAAARTYMGAMLAHIEHAPVAEAFLTLVCKPHSAALMRFYSCTPPKKWAFFRALSDWKLLLVLASHVTEAEYSEAHTIGAADVFVELLDRLAADENGELLLQPAAYCPELLEGLVSAAVDRSGARSIGQRTAAIKCVFRLLQKSSPDKVQGPPTSPYQSFGATIVNMVPNQLAPLREKIFSLIETHLPKLLKYLVDKYDHQQTIEMDLEAATPVLPPGAVRHTAYVVKVPFTEYRLTLVQTLVEIVAHNPSKLTTSDLFDARVWRVLVTWFFEYAHNNLYHAAFYQLVFIAMRADAAKQAQQSHGPSAFEVLVKKIKLVSLLVEHYQRDEAGASNGSPSYKGYILQMCNVFRLQAASQSPDAFLRSFLQSHTIWRGFEPELRANTSLLTNSGLGFHVPQPVPRGGFLRDTWQPGGNPDDLLLGDSGEGIDHGSDFARSLGFVDEVAWPDEAVSEGARKKKKKGKKKGKKKSKADGDDDEHEHDEHEHDEHDEHEENGEAIDPTDDSDASSEATSNGDGSKAPHTPKKKGKKKKSHKK